MLRVTEVLMEDQKQNDQNDCWDSKNPAEEILTHLLAPYFEAGLSGVTAAFEES